MPDRDREATGDRPDEVVRGLTQLLSLQQFLQVNAFKINPGGLGDHDRLVYVVNMCTALSAELHEALDEINWKPWTTDDTFHRDAYLKELVDALHFLMNLILVARYPKQSVSDLAAEVFAIYEKKREVNRRRQESGTYDGRSTKCGWCGRAIEDGKRSTDDEDVFVCPCGSINHLEVST